MWFNDDLCALSIVGGICKCGGLRWRSDDDRVEREGYRVHTHKCFPWRLTESVVKSCLWQLVMWFEYVLVCMVIVRGVVVDG